MGYKKPLIKKAVLTLLVGTAFIISSCQGGMVVKPGEGTLTGYAGAVADYEAGRYSSALRTFDNILAVNPEHPEVKMIRYYQAFCRYYTGDYTTSIALATDWMKNYPDSPEMYKIQKLAGDASRASGLMYDACFWLTVSLKTAKAAGVPGYFQDIISDSIADVIARSNENELEKIEQLDNINLFLSSIYLRRSELALEKGAYSDAKGFAKLAIQSAEENEQPELAATGLEYIKRINKKIEETSNIKRRAIGCLLPLKGPASLYGEELLNGIQLGMDIFNTSNADAPLELIIKNTNYSPEETLTAVDELIFDDKVIAIIGPLSSSASVTAAEKAQEYGVPIITFTQKQDITEVGDMVFRNYLTPSRELDVLLNRAVIEMGMSRFGIFYPETSYGNYFMNLFWDKIEELGGEITAVESYRSEDTDFSEGIKKMVGLYYPRPESVFEMLKAEKMDAIQGEFPEDSENLDMTSEKGVTETRGEEAANLSENSAAPYMTDDEIRSKNTEPADTEAFEARSNESLDSENLDTEQADEAEIDEEAMTEPVVDFDAVFIPDNSQNIAQIAPQFPFNEIFNVPFLGTSLWMSDELISTTSDYLQGAMFPVGFYLNSDSEIVRDFVRLYRNAYGKDPGVLAATGFDTIRMIKRLIKEIDITTRTDFQQALLGNEMYEGVTGRISFDERGEVEKSPLLLTVYGRKLHALQ